MKTKKTDQAKPWNRRSAGAKNYQMRSRDVMKKRFLIFCEGSNTEPCYFEAFPLPTAIIKAVGTGRSKTSLVDHALKYLTIEPRDPDLEVWLVFDMDINGLQDIRDQRSDFNRAVKKAQENGFKVAYSNDAFELWFLLHYRLIDAALTRSEFYEQLSKLWNGSYENHAKKRQFCQGIYEKLLNDNSASQENAIRNAERLHRQVEQLPPADQNPCTTVYLLVKQLNMYMKK